MKITKTIIILFLSIWTTFGYGQSDYTFVLEINADYGLSNDFSDNEYYRTRTFGELLYVDQRSTMRTRNYMFSTAWFFNRKSGAKISFGLSTFGFNAIGRNDVTGALLNSSYQITLLEWGLSYTRRFTLSESATLLVEPGLRYHSDGDTNSPVIRISRNDAFAFSWYTGIEIPMQGNQFFANLGLQVKIPLERYSNDFSEQPPYHPYFIGVKFGVNFQFFEME